MLILVIFTFIAFCARIGNDNYPNFIFDWIMFLNIVEFLLTILNRRNHRNEFLVKHFAFKSSVTDR